MILCIDIGNSLIYCGVFLQGKLLVQFRYGTTNEMSSDQFGTFVRSVIQAHQLDWQAIKYIAICSVVPELEYSVRAACIKNFTIEPMILVMGAKTGLRVTYSNPQEVGADRIATALGAETLYPDQNIVIVDMGTATTVGALTAGKEYMGGAILPGIKTSIKALATNTAKLPMVDMSKPALGLGRTTKQNIQIGLYYGQLGAIREIIDYLAEHAFVDKPYMVVATGGFSELFRDEQLFDALVPDLVLIGLYRLHILNHPEELI